MVFLGIGVARAAPLADCQGIDERRTFRSVHRLEERRQEGRQLIAGGPEPVRLPEPHGKFVKQDQRRLATKEFAQRAGPRRDGRFVTSPHPFIADRPRERIADLAPRGPRQHPVAHLPAVRRICVLPVEYGEPHGSPRKERRVQELLDVRDPGHPAGGVRERDQPVGLAAAVGGVEPEDRRGLTAGPGEPATDVAEQRLQAARRMRVPGRTASDRGIPPALRHPRRKPDRPRTRHH